MSQRSIQPFSIGREKDGGDNNEYYEDEHDDNRQQGQQQEEDKNFYRTTAITPQEFDTDDDDESDDIDEGDRLAFLASRGIRKYLLHERLRSLELQRRCLCVLVVLLLCALVANLGWDWQNGVLVIQKNQNNNNNSGGTTQRDDDDDDEIHVDDAILNKLPTDVKSISDDDDDDTTVAAAATMAPYISPVEEEEVHCGCPDTCTPSTGWGSVTSGGGDGFTCGERIQWLLQESPNHEMMYPTEADACRYIASIEFPCECAGCDPERCHGSTIQASTSTLSSERIKVPADWNPPPSLIAAIQEKENDSIRGSQDDAEEEDDYNSNLYCFPPYEGGQQERKQFTLWGGKTIQVKEGGPCGPGINSFSAENVQVDETNNQLTLYYRHAASSEVRVTLPPSAVSDEGASHVGPSGAYTYGLYEFEVERIETVLHDSNNNNGNNTRTTTTTLPKELTFGLFTWNDKEDYSKHEHMNHEVDIEIGRWNCASNADAQFLVQPPGYPQTYRFFTGDNDDTKNAASGAADNNNNDNRLNEGGRKFYYFLWSAGKMQWGTSHSSPVAAAAAATGETQQQQPFDDSFFQFELTTEELLYRNQMDWIQCMPDPRVEVRINLWNMMNSEHNPDIMTNDEDYVQVVISNFTFVPLSTLISSSLSSSLSEYIHDGDLCSKNCQCKDTSSCVNLRCKPNS